MNTLKGSDMTGAPIDEALANMPDFGPEHLGYLKNSRTRLEVVGLLDTVAEPFSEDPAERLSEIRKLILIAPSELMRLLSFKDEKLRLIMHAKLVRSHQVIANEIDRLRRGEKSKILSPLSIRQSKHNAEHVRRFRQVLGSALLILSGPKRGDGKGGNLRSGDLKYMMTREASMNFILDTLIEEGFEGDRDWLRSEFTRFHSRPKDISEPYVDPPSRLSIEHAINEREEGWSEDDTLALVKSELGCELRVFESAEEQYQKSQTSDPDPSDSAG